MNKGINLGYPETTCNEPTKLVHQIGLKDATFTSGNEIPVFAYLPVAAILVRKRIASCLLATTCSALSKESEGGGRVRVRVRERERERKGERGGVGIWDG